MNSGAKKFNFKMKEEPNKDFVKNSAPSSVLKFHHLPKENISKEDVDISKNKSHLSLKKNGERKEIKRKKYHSNNYFGVKNHIDLFEIGKHFSYLQQNGIKSLAFHGSQSTVSVQHSILGLSSFFNYHKNIKATVFVNEFEGSELAKHLKPTHVELELVALDDVDENYEIYACDGVDVIELNKLKHIAHKMGPNAFSEFLTKLVADSEIVFWQLPQVSEMDKEREIYLPILNVIDSLTLVVDTCVTKRKEISEMNDFAEKYQIQVEGVLLYKKSKG